MACPLLNAKIIKYTAPKVALPGAWKGRVAFSADWDGAETNAEIESLCVDTE